MSAADRETTSRRWFELHDATSVDSPALLVYPERVRENVRRMLQITGGPARLRPHVKTHKLPQLVAMQREMGIEKFKCATIAEAEMLAEAGATDILLGYAVLGPAVVRLMHLIARFPAVKWITLADDAAAIDALAAAVEARGVSLEVALDLDVGQQRTGIAPGPKALALYERIARSRNLLPGGLHCYDGHMKQRDAGERAAAVELAMRPVHGLAADIARRGVNVPRIVAGGSPTLEIHARDARLECSPGTTIFWDASYSDKFPELDFPHAAVLLTRVVSRPTPDRLTCDLGYKAVSADNPDPRAVFFDLPDARAVIHNEEHLTVVTSRAERYRPGDVLYALPWHVCPTVALHQEALVVEAGRVVDHWPITARDRRLTI